jgi:hypothetical protein
MSGYFERYKDAYNDHLLRVSQTGDWSPWLDFFLRGVVESARESVDARSGLRRVRHPAHRGERAGGNEANNGIAMCRLPPAQCAGARAGLG